MNKFELVERKINELESAIPEEKIGSNMRIKLSSSGQLYLTTMVEEITLNFNQSCLLYKTLEEWFKDDK